MYDSLLYALKQTGPYCKTVWTEYVILCKYILEPINTPIILHYDCTVNHCVKMSSVNTVVLVVELTTVKVTHNFS